MESVQHNLHTPSGDHVHVMEVPNTFFNGVQVCLAVKDKKDIKKGRYMVPLFKKFLDEQSRNGQSNIIVGGGYVTPN